MTVPTSYICDNLNSLKFYTKPFELYECFGHSSFKATNRELGTNCRFSAEELPRELVWRLVIWFTQSTRSTSTHTHTKMRRTWSCTQATLLSWTFEGEILLMVKFIHRPHTNWIPRPSKHYKYLEYSWKNFYSLRLLNSILILYF